MYAPPVDWDIIRQVKRAVQVPVIGNGDVTDARSAAALCLAVIRAEEGTEEV